jgi:phenylacetate-CoA ligase
MGFAGDKLYPLLPIPLQNVAISAFGLGWHRRRFGGVFAAHLRAFREREGFSTSQWRDYQEHELRRLLVHAFTTVPHYRRKYEACGWTEADFQRFRLEDLPRLPLLEKRELREFGQTTLLSTVREKGGSFFASSGSTGTPTKILLSHAAHQRWSAACEARVRDWAGVDHTMARGMIGGRRILPEGNARPPYYRYNAIERQVYFSAYHISGATAASYVEGMHRHQIDYLTGYAMSNYILARFIAEARLEAPRLRAVITSSEKLTPEMRAQLEQVYRCRVFDAWSSVECCGQISECERGGHHVTPDAGIIEFRREDGSAASPGETGEIICTGFLNYDQPLIRYRIGDLALLAATPCACGRAMTTVSDIVGRLEDVVVGPDGREMVRFHGIFINLPDVVEGQVVQHDRERFQINVVTTRGSLPAEQASSIVMRMRSQLGDGVAIDVVPVAEIPRNRNGKFQAVISHVRRDGESPSRRG